MFSAHPLQVWEFLHVLLENALELCHGLHKIYGYSYSPRWNGYLCSGTATSWHVSTITSSIGYHSTLKTTRYSSGQIQYAFSDATLHRTRKNVPDIEVGVNILNAALVYIGKRLQNQGNSLVPRNANTNAS